MEVAYFLADVMDELEQELSGFAFLKEEIGKRLKAPVKHTNFWGYLFLAIFVLGGLSVYIEWFRYGAGKTQNSEGIVLALFTVFPAIMGASAVQLVLDKDNSPTRMAGLISLFLCALLTFVFTADPFEISKTIAVICGIVCCLIAVLVWWIANGEEEIFRDTIKPYASMGGSKASGKLNSKQTDVET